MPEESFRFETDKQGYKYAIGSYVFTVRSSPLPNSLSKEELIPIEEKVKGLLKAKILGEALRWVGIIGSIPLNDVLANGKEVTNLGLLVVAQDTALAHPLLIGDDKVLSYFRMLPGFKMLYKDLVTLDKKDG